MDETELRAILHRCIDEYHWMWGVTRKFIRVRTGVLYDMAELKRVYAGQPRDTASAAD